MQKFGHSPWHHDIIINLRANCNKTLLARTTNEELFDYWQCVMAVQKIDNIYITIDNLMKIQNTVARLKP